MSCITKKKQIRTLACQTATVRRTTHGERERGRGEREPRAAGGTAPENSPEVQNYPVPQQRRFSCLREQNKNTSLTRSTQPTCTAAPFTAGETWGWRGRKRRCVHATERHSATEEDEAVPAATTQGSERALCSERDTPRGPDGPQDEAGTNPDSANTLTAAASCVAGGGSGP